MRKGLSRHGYRSSGNVFSPASLFVNGEQGAWYDPSDYTTLFQDSAGTTPVTAVEQAVGLMLDKSKFLALGAELFTSASAAGAAPVNANGTVATSGTNTTCTCTAAGTYGVAFTVTPSAIGTSYRFVITIVSQSVSGRIYIDFGGGSLGFIDPPASGVVRYSINVANTTTPLRAYMLGGSIGNQFTISFDSVKAIAGNHAYQSTSASRPVLRARYNLLTYSEDYTNAAWLKNGVSVTGSAGNQTLTVTGSGGSRSISQLVGNPNSTITFRVTVSAGNVNNAVIGLFTTGFVSVTASVVSGPGSVSGSSIILISGLQSGVQTTVSITTNATVAAIVYAYIYPKDAGEALGSTIMLHNTDVRFASQATGLIGPTYQRIADAATYDSVGFLPYLAFDGVDDSLLTNSVDFSATDKMTVWAGVRKLSDAGDGIVAELSANVSTNDGSFYLAAPESSSSLAYAFLGRGNTPIGIVQRASVALTSYPAPITNVVTSTGDIVGDLNTIRINGVTGASGTGDQGAGNYGNYPLYIGRRNNATLPLNGNLYSLIIRGAQSSAAQISSTETWVNGKTGAY